MLSRLFTNYDKTPFDHKRPEGFFNYKFFRNLSPSLVKVVFYLAPNRLPRSYMHIAPS